MTTPDLHLGYCCINTALSAQGVTTGRTMRKATFQKDGLAAASALAVQNVKDLLRILRWNADHGVRVFRMGSNMFPWASEYALSDLPDFATIRELLVSAGTFAHATHQRLTFHPDHFVKLASTNDDVAWKSVQELNMHDEIMNLMNLPMNGHYSCINIHVGQNFSRDTAKRFIERYHMLNSTTANRLVVENDDKENCFSVRQLYDHIYSTIATPITFDYFHHTFHPDGLSEEDAVRLAASTWGNGRPLFHYSESKNLHENISGNPRAHSDYVTQVLNTYGIPMDIDLEAKAKEAALLQIRKQYHAGAFTLETPPNMANLTP